MNTGIAYGGPLDGQELSSDHPTIEAPSINPSYDPLNKGIAVNSIGHRVDGAGNYPFQRHVYRWKDGRWEYEPARPIS